MKYTSTLCLMLMVFSITLYSQQVTQIQKGEIRGKIIDLKTKEPLGFVAVSLFNQKEVLKAYTISDEDGNYVLKNLSAGEYSLKVTYIGYVNARVINIDVIDDHIIFQNISMQEGGGIIRCGVVVEQKKAECIDTKKEISSYQQLRKEYAVECNQDFTCTLPHKSREIENKLKESAVKLFNEVTVFPNPAVDHINIESMYDGNKLIKIYSVTGALYYSGTIVHHLHLDVSSFPKGVYFVTIIDKENDEKNYSKFIVAE